MIVTFTMVFKPLDLHAPAWLGRVVGSWHSACLLVPRNRIAAICRAGDDRRRNKGEPGYRAGQRSLAPQMFGYRIINDFSTLVIFSSGASGGNVAR
jgi:hypothetical protein